MFYQKATVFVLFALLNISLQATNDGNPPVLTINIADVQLREKEDARTRLGSGAVATCVDAGDGDPVRVFIKSIFPVSGCGLRCFQLEPINNKPSEFKLLFQPAANVGTALSYTLTLSCTDDIEPAVEKTMSVTIVTNTPPTFIPNNPPERSVSVKGQRTTHDTNYQIYKVRTNEPDGDPVEYTMSTNPSTPYIEMEPASGQIRAAHDLKLLCEPLVVASVNAKDPYNPPIGPFTVNMNIDKYNQKPEITNTDTTVPVDEDIAVGKTIFTLTVDDKTLTDFTFNLQSVTSEGVEAYEMVDEKLKTRVLLNYEREDQRSVKLYFTVNDGYCKSDIYTVDVDIKDVPEAPVMTPPKMFIEVFEGEINVPSNFIVTDEDLNEVFTYNKEKGTDDEFDVDPATGNIVSVGSVDLKRNTKFKDFEVKMSVTDKDGLKSDKSTVKVRVFDANTQRPYFDHRNVPVRLSALDCTPPGAQLGKLRGKDDDSNYNQNKWIYFGGGGEKMGVAANGNVYLTEYCLNGESYVGTATIADQGIFPGPLTGDSIEIVLDCGPCPPGGLPSDDDDDGDDDDDADDSNGNTTVVLRLEDLKNSRGSLSSKRTLTWLVPSVLAGVIWLGLTGILLYNFFPSISCSKPNVAQITPQPAKPAPPLKVRPSLPPQPPAQPKQVNPSPPPPPPRVISPSDPYLHDFWKETYTDQDHSQQPDRRAKPTAIENMPPAEQNIPPQNLRLGPPGSYNQGPPSVPQLPGGPPDASPPPKGKWCTIL